MANHLEVLDAYKAGITDLKLAEQRATERSLSRKRYRPVCEYEQTLREELDYLCRQRISRGELPQPAEVTSEAA